jgi:hypothetical protein
MTLREWELCSGNCPPERPCSKETSERYRAMWDRLRAEEAHAESREDGVALEDEPVENDEDWARARLRCRFHGEDALTAEVGRRGRPRPKTRESKEG